MRFVEGRPKSEFSVDEYLGKYSPELLTEFYLRLLYSEGAGARCRAVMENGTVIDQRVRSFLDTVNFDRLEIERAARVRNLRTRLVRGCAAFFSFIDKDEGVRLATVFCESREFWRFVGRSLEENFAIVACEYLRDCDEPFLAEVVKLNGVISGLLEKPRSASPWNRSLRIELKESDAAAIEEYESPFPLVDPDGNLPNPANRGELSVRRASRIRISTFPGRRVKIETEDA